MNELEKVVRVIKKVDASAPHAVLLVLDATVGQNALSQVEAFCPYSGSHGAGNDKTRRHRARRHPGGTSRKAQTAGAFYRRRAKGSTTWRRSRRGILRRRLQGLSETDLSRRAQERAPQDDGGAKRDIVILRRCEAPSRRMEASKVDGIE